MKKKINKYFNVLECENFIINKNLINLCYFYVKNSIVNNSNNNYHSFINEVYNNKNNLNIFKNLNNIYIIKNYH